MYRIAHRDFLEKGDSSVDEDLEKLIKEAYEHILQTSNKILRNCKLFSIEMLQLEDPTYAEIAEQLEEVAEMISVVIDGHTETAETFRYAVKAKEYSQNISKIAGAIRLDEQELLEEYIQELDRRPFL